MLQGVSETKTFYWGKGFYIYWPILSGWNPFVFGKNQYLGLDIPLMKPQNGKTPIKISTENHTNGRENHMI